MRANGGGGHRARTHARTQALSPPRPPHGAVVLPPPLPNATVLPAALQRGRPDPITPSPPFAPPPPPPRRRGPLPGPAFPGYQIPHPWPPPSHGQTHPPGGGGGTTGTGHESHTLLPSPHRPPRSHCSRLLPAAFTSVPPRHSLAPTRTVFRSPPGTHSPGNGVQSHSGPCYPRGPGGFSVAPLLPGSPHCSAEGKLRQGVGQNGGILQIVNWHMEPSLGSCGFLGACGGEQRAKQGGSATPSRRATPCHAVPCHAVPRCATLCRTVPRRAMPCHAVPCRAISLAGSRVPGYLVPEAPGSTPRAHGTLCPRQRLGVCQGGQRGWVRRSGGQWGAEATSACPEPPQPPGTVGMPQPRAPRPCRCPWGGETRSGPGVSRMQWGGTPPAGVGAAVGPTCPPPLAGTQG